ncbi:hypothetical protein [Streptomyces albireticuli]|uniref:Uncharacterized protein n=1 Tax=Streptomyces albireticuli TaxID=1940 RepID=A0A2A2CZP7_9ACTN|nr:hypothetical protein [Streptomyces albireticuli]MCD9145795.1 hypothetical protein [Streptomyces albireticuli]MCD9165872.1 hypothetical protein [Streptomyces albireticuli]MCD9194449.1 hypothetical protein [Streptomyces albireticuli]PAU44552.1 hypothetical protein CK936_34270 [Streptomyces albireticuli]
MKAVALNLVRGSWALTYRTIGRVCAWCMAGEGASKVWRALALVIGVGTAFRLTGSSPIVAGGVYLAWLGVAWMQSPPLAAEPEDEVDEAVVPAAEADEEPDGEEPVAASADPLEPAEFLARLRALIGDRNGVLLRTVVADRHEAGAPADWGVPEARALCTALGVPVKDSIKVAGDTSVGVHRTALPSPPPWRPPRRVVR